MNFIELTADTDANFNVQFPDALASVQAATGDRIKMLEPTKLGGDIAEVIMVRKQGIVARSLLNPKIKYDLPLNYCVSGSIHNDKHLFLYRSPKNIVIKTPSKTRQKRVKGGITKIQRCRELYAANPSLDKAAMLELFQREAGCTPLGANTYYLLCKKG